MASIDSGVDTGNDSNDSFAQDKSLTVQMEHPNSFFQLTPLRPLPVFEFPKEDNDATKNDETENVDDKIDSCSGRCRKITTFTMEPPAGLSFLHLQPSTLSAGYSVHDFAYAPGIRDFFPEPRLTVLKDEASDYKQSPTLTKMRSLIGDLQPKCIKLKPMVSVKKYKRPGAIKIRATPYSTQIDQNRLRVAAFMNDVKRVDELLSEKFVNPNCPDHQRRTPLHLAACNGYTEVVRLLLSHGANPNVRDMIGNTPLHLAVCTNHIDVVTLLLNAGTDVSSNNLTGRSPLQLAQSKLRIIKRSQDSEYKHLVTTQVIEMLLTFIKRKHESLETIDEELLNSFQTRLKVSETQEQVENELQNLLDNLSSLTLTNSSTSTVTTAN